MLKPFGLLLLILTSGVVRGEPIELNCRIEPHVRVDVSSSAEGVVAEILVKKNDTVAVGQVLARLEAKLESATADLRRLQADHDSDVDAQALALDFASRNLKRVQNLYEKKVASFAELDKAKTEHLLAEQQLRQAKDRKQQAAMEYKRALADLERKTIKSPIAGIVTDVFKDPGEHIYFEPIMQLIALDPLRIEAFAQANLFGQFKPGAIALVLPDSTLGQKSYTAKIEQVDKVIDAPSNTFGIVLSLPNKDHALPSGLKCRVRFTGVETRNSLLEP